MKRALDVVLASLGLLLLSPLLISAMYLIYRQDRHSPLYIAPRAGRDRRPFRMVKLRSMVIDADQSGVNSTAVGDRRITPVGRLVRRLKLDEVPQLWNVLRGDMSLVGPRPNVESETRLYTAEEQRLLTVRPGITDFASIVFADEGQILAGQEDPDLAYNQLIRPGKSRLGLQYVDNASLGLDLALIGLTLVAIASPRLARAGVAGLLAWIGAPEDLIRLARRDEQLRPAPPPGATAIVQRSAAGSALTLG